MTYVIEGWFYNYHDSNDPENVWIKYTISCAFFTDYRIMLNLSECNIHSAIYKNFYAT